MAGALRGPGLYTAPGRAGTPALGRLLWRGLRFIGAHAPPLLRRAAPSTRSICSSNPPIGKPNTADSSFAGTSFAPRFLRSLSFLRLPSHSFLFLTITLAPLRRFLPIVPVTAFALASL